MSDGALALPLMTRYRTILADPPWRVDGSQNDGRPWCSKGGRRELANAVPPAYCEHIGGFLMREVRGRLAAC